MINFRLQKLTNARQQTSWLPQKPQLAVCPLSVNIVQTAVDCELINETTILLINLINSLHILRLIYTHFRVYAPLKCERNVLNDCPLL